MDPNKILEEIRAAVADVRQPELRFESGDSWENIATDLANAVDDLDEWLRKGGFPPRDWDKEPV